MKRTRHAAALAVTAGTFLWTALAFAQDNVGAAPPPPGGPTVVQDQPADPPAPVPSSAPLTSSGPAGTSFSGTSFGASGQGGGNGGSGGNAGGGGNASGGGGNGGARRNAAATANGPLTGYSYGDHDSPEVQAILAGHPRRYTGATSAPDGHLGRGRRATVARSGGGSVATYPGFMMRDDGGSRVFVQLTKAVPIEEHRAAGEITYLLKGAHVTERNNENALVTVHFNTPVSRARLRPVGRDLALTVELRGAAQPTYKMESSDGGSRLVIDFPEGHFLDDSGEPMRTSRAQTLAGDTSGRPRALRAAHRGARRKDGAPHPPAPDSSGMSDTTDTNP